MTKEELVARLRDIEWDDFEVKAAKSDLPKNIWETVSAFSNCSGGWIVLGVKQSGRLFEIVGVDNIEKLEQDFFGTLRSKKFNLPLFATLHRYEIDGKNVIAFYIPSSEVKPVYFGSLENSFIRMGSGDQRATQQEIMSMIRDQSFGIQSQKSIPGTCIDMLDRDALTDFRGEVRHWGLVSHLDSVSDEVFCKGVGITDYSGQLTYGGLIMLGKSPYIFNFVPTFCADYVEIPGTGMEAMTNNYTYRIPEQQNLWEASRVILRRLRTLVNTPMVGINERGQSVEDFSEYDILREAMANQMAHADHFSPRRSCIHVFDDRIEFLNPGGMPMPVDVMESSFESQPRNPVIAKMFRLAHLSENLGYGLRKLKRWQEVTGRPMHIETTINSVKVTFDLQTREVEKSDVVKNVVKNVAKNVAKNLTERQQQIIALIGEDSQITRAEMAATIGVATKTIERELTSLSDIVRYVGSKKSGHWEIRNFNQN